MLEGSASSYIDAISLCVMTIAADRERLERNELGKIDVEDFKLSMFRTKFRAAVQSLNNEVTKIGFICSKQPSSDDLDSMVLNLSQHYHIMKELYMTLPLDVGRELHKGVRSTVLSIMKTLYDFLNSLRNLTEKGAKERLTLTGAFWDACKAVETLPKDNLQATFRIVRNVVDLAADAKEELETTLKEDNEGEGEFRQWTDSERKLAQNALGLAKVTHVCVKWLRDALRKAGSSATPQQLDIVASVVSTVSPALDDFVSELYHPVDFQIVYEMAERLVGALRALLTTVKDSHFAEAFNLDYINKCEQFISHNHQKLDPSMAAASQLENLSLTSNHVTGSLTTDPCSSHNSSSFTVLEMDICDVCGEAWPRNGQDMKPNVKTEKGPTKEDSVDTEVIAKDPTVLSQRPSHTKTSDVIVVMILATFLLLYVLAKDWLLIAINGVLLCLYVFFIRRRLPLPVYGTMDLVEYLNKIS